MHGNYVSNTHGLVRQKNFGDVAPSERVMELTLGDPRSAIQKSPPYGLDMRTWATSTQAGTVWRNVSEARIMEQ